MFSMNSHALLIKGFLGGSKEEDKPRNDPVNI